MSLDVNTISVIGIIFVATLFRSAFGFGEALLAVPILVFFIPLQIAAPLVVQIGRAHV